eukprot:11497679-Alexandrium_andersonii.AAC.1
MSGPHERRSAIEPPGPPMQVDAEADGALPPPAISDGRALPAAPPTPAAPPARSSAAAAGEEPAVTA